MGPHFYGRRHWIRLGDVLKLIVLTQFPHPRIGGGGASLDAPLTSQLFDGVSVSKASGSNTGADGHFTIYNSPFTIWFFLGVIQMTHKFPFYEREIIYGVGGGIPTPERGKEKGGLYNYTKTPP